MKFLKKVNPVINKTLIAPKHISFVIENNRILDNHVFVADTEKYVHHINKIDQEFFGLVSNL